MQRRGLTSGRALAAAVALLVAFAALAGAAWWWLGLAGPRLVQNGRVEREASDATAPLPSPVRSAVPPPRSEASQATASDLKPARGPDEPHDASAWPPRANPPSPPLHGRVTATNGTPIEGAELVGEEPRGDPWRIPFVLLFVPAARPLAISDADGRFTLPAQASDPGLLFVRASGFGLRWVTTEELSIDAALPAPVELDVECRLQARVLGAGELPIEGADVVASLHALDAFDVVLRGTDRSGEGVLRGPPIVLAATTDRDGRATIAGLPASSALSFTVVPPESMPGQLAIVEATALRMEPGATVERTWQLGGGIKLRGRLLDETGAPLADVLIWLATQGAQLDRNAESAFFTPGDESHVVARAFTDEEGRFDWGAVAAGDYWIGPAAWSRIGLGHAGGDLVPLAQPLSLPAGSVSSEVELQAQRGLFVTGRALDRRGGPVPGTLRVRELGNAIAGEVPSYADVEGNFRAGPLSEGDYELRFLPSDLRYAAAPPLNARAGSRDLRIEVADAAALVMVARFDGRGEPVAASFLLVQQGGDAIAWTGGRGATPSSDDRFDGLPAGNFTLGATTTDGFAGFLEGVTLAEGETRAVDVVLQRGATVEVRYRAGPVTLAQVALQSGAVVIAAGELALGSTQRFTAPAGPVRLRVGLGAGTVVRDLELVAGGREEVVIDEP